jgi:hypothetical protein
MGVDAYKLVASEYPLFITICYSLYSTLHVSTDLGGCFEIVPKGTE